MENDKKDAVSEQLSEIKKWCILNAFSVRFEIEDHTKCGDTFHVRARAETGSIYTTKWGSTIDDAAERLYRELMDRYDS